MADIVTEGEAKVESKKGNEIKKNASEDDPAVVIERSGVSAAFIEDHTSTGLLSGIKHVI